MIRANPHANRKTKPPDPNSKVLQLETLYHGGKANQAAAAREVEVVLQPATMTDDGGENTAKPTGERENKTSEMNQENLEKGRRQFPVKLEFKIAREARFFNCATKHREWFETLQRKDPSARIITYKEISIKNIKDFPKTQEQYNKAFPQRVTRQPGQPRAAEIVFEIETQETFQTLKTFNSEMMEFLGKNGVYMKMNIASSLRRDSVGFFTHIHPKATWRIDFQEVVNNAICDQLSEQQIEKAKQAADNKEKEDQFVTLNFRKLYVNSKEGLIQTEVLEVQTSPEIKETINNALFTVAKKNILPGRYYPYGISRSLGMEEYKNILKRQNAFLEETQIIGIQGLTEEILDFDIRCNDRGTEVTKSVREIITEFPSVYSLEKTNLTSERGKYMLIIEKKKESEIKEKIDMAFEYINEKIPEEARHPTHPEIRRATTNRWATQIQEYAEKYQHNDDQQKLPKRPPNAWDRKIILVNDPESFPKLMVQKKAPEQKKTTPEKNLPRENDFDKKLKEIEERISKQFEDRIKKMEQKCDELQERINKTLLTIDNLAENFLKSEDRTKMMFDQQMKNITTQLQEFARQLQGGSREETMESEPTDSRKRSAKGKGKSHLENDFIP